MTLKLLDPFGSGKIVLFAVTYDRVRLDNLFVPAELTAHVARLRTGTRSSFGDSLGSVSLEGSTARSSAR